MADPTPNFGWDKPNVASDAGSWGGLLNAIFDDIDTELKSAQDAGTGSTTAVKKAGDTMTGHLETLTASADGQSIPTGSGDKTIDLSLANFWFQAGTLTGAVTFDVVNPQGSASPSFEAVILMPRNLGACSSVTWKKGGAAMTLWWQDGVEPTWTASGYDVIVLFSYDGGSTWIGVHAVADPS